MGAPRLLLAWLALVLAGLAHGQQSGFSGRVLLAADGRTKGLVLPLNHQPGRPRTLLRSGNLPIHGAVREG